MYKDKDKQKEANRLAKQRFDAKNKDIIQKPVIDEIKTNQDKSQSTKSVIPSVYIGVCYQDNTGQWQVRKDIKFAPVISQAQLDTLPAAVARPDTDWPYSHTAAYKQTLYNLLTMSLAQLKSIGQYIPCWYYDRHKAE